MRYAIGALGGLGVTAAALVGCSLGLSGLAADADGGTAVQGEAGAHSDADAATSPAPADASGPGEASGGQGSASDAANGGGSGANDASPPTTPDGGCAGVLCNGQCTTDTDCSGCAGATLLCRGTGECQSDCGSCPGSPIECYACDVNRQNPLGTCEPQSGGSYCLDTNYAGVYDGGQGYHCACQTADDCPGDSQVCLSLGGSPEFVCYTCGESFTQGGTCKSGGQCNDQKAACN